MRFVAPSHLWLLVPLAGLVAAYLAVQRRRKRDAVRFTNLALLDTVAPRRPGWRRHVPAAGLLLALLALVAGFARPTWPVRVPRERATIVMAIDTSISMNATDVEPTRLDAAKTAGSLFVDRLPPRVNLGLVSFSGVAQVLVSPTLDHESVKTAINRLSLGPRTAIGEAIFASLDSIRWADTGATGDLPPSRIVLMSDGETTAGRPNQEAARAAAEARVPVSTIAYGTPHGMVNTGEGLTPVPVNKTALREIAAATGGQFLEAASASELRRVYSDLGRSIGYETRRREVTGWLVGAGLALAMASAAGSLVWSSRLP